MPDGLLNGLLAVLAGGGSLVQCSNADRTCCPPGGPARRPPWNWRLSRGEADLPLLGGLRPALTRRATDNDPPLNPTRARPAEHDDQLGAALADSPFGRCTRKSAPTMSTASSTPTTGIAKPRIEQRAADELDVAANAADTRQWHAHPVERAGGAGQTPLGELLPAMGDEHHADADPADECGHVLDHGDSPSR